VNTKAIQAAIDACTPNGTVYVPAGTFLAGALFLKSAMTLFVEKLGRLQGSAETIDYPLMHYLWEGREHLCYASLINTVEPNGSRLFSITIAGEGTIDASGMQLFRAEMNEQKGKRGHSICLRNVDSVYMKDITVRCSPSWCIHPILCNNLSMNNIKVHTRNDEYGRVYTDVFNGDGIDPEYCENVFIFHSLIASQDDCIAVKSGRDEEGRAMGVVSKNIRISNCTFRSGFGVALGSEMAGGIDNVLVQDCMFENVYSIGSVKAPRPRGAFIKNVVFDSCTYVNKNLEYNDCKYFRGAIYIDQFYGKDEMDTISKQPVDESTSVIENITFKNIVLDTYTGNAIFMAGLPESPLKNIRLENVTAIGKHGMKAYNMESLVLENVSNAAREGDIMLLENVIQI
jgi:exo-poly-alpha-galacturonosidase